MNLPVYLLYLLVLLGLLVALYWIALGKSRRQAYLFACLAAALALLVPIVVSDAGNKTFLLLTIAAGAATGGLCILHKKPAAFAFSLAPLGVAAYTIAVALYFNDAAPQQSAAIQRLALILVLVCGGLCATGSPVAYLVMRNPKYQPKRWCAQSNRLLYPSLTGLTILIVFIPHLALFVLLSVLSLISGATLAGATNSKDHDMLPALFNTIAGITACALGFVLGAAVLLVAGAMLCSAGIGFCRTVCNENNRPFRLVLSGLLGHLSADRRKAT